MKIGILALLTFIILGASAVANGRFLHHGIIKEYECGNIPGIGSSCVLLMRETGMEDMLILDLGVFVLKGTDQESKIKSMKEHGTWLIVSDKFDDTPMTDLATPVTNPTALKSIKKIVEKKMDTTYLNVLKPLFISTSLIRLDQ